MVEVKKKVALIGAPTDVGASHRGASMAPEALRVAGIEKSLRRLQLVVTDHGNLSGPPNPERAREGDYRHLKEVTAWCALVRDAVYSAMQRGEVPIVMGGDHSLAIGSIAAIARHCAEAGRTSMSPPPPRRATFTACRWPWLQGTARPS